MKNELLILSPIKILTLQTFLVFYTFLWIVTTKVVEMICKKEKRKKFHSYQSCYKNYFSYKKCEI